MVGTFRRHEPPGGDQFAKDNSLRVAGDLMRISWFGRVEFVKEGKVYLSLGQNAGVKVGDRLKVVVPGKEVVNPTTHAVLGFTADVTQGEVKVTEFLGNSGAVATPVSGGPFNANDRVRAEVVNSEQEVERSESVFGKLSRGGVWGGWRVGGRSGWVGGGGVYGAVGGVGEGGGGWGFREGHVSSEQNQTQGRQGHWLAGDQGAPGILGSVGGWLKVSLPGRARPDSFPTGPPRGEGEFAEAS